VVLKNGLTTQPPSTSIGKLIAQAIWKIDYKKMVSIR
jgi:hypothetical protein